MTGLPHLPLIRAASPADARALAEVHLRTVLRAYAGIFPPEAPAPTAGALAAEWASAFGDPTFRAFLAVGPAGPAGTVGVRADPGEAGCGELRRLHVLPGLWGRGVGSAPYEAAMRELAGAGYRAAALWVLEQNARARSFYERRGWALVSGQAQRWPAVGTAEVRYRIALPAAPRPA